MRSFVVGRSRGTHVAKAASRGGPQRQQTQPMNSRMLQQPGAQGRRWRVPGGRGPNGNRRLLLGAGVIGGGALLFNWIFGVEDYDLGKFLGRS